MKSACRTRKKLHRGSKLAGRSAVYTHRTIGKVLEELQGRNIHQAAQIPVYEFGHGFIDSVASTLQRREQITLSVTERQLYLDISGKSFDTEITSHHFS